MQPQTDTMPFFTAFRHAQDLDGAMLLRVKDWLNVPTQYSNTAFDEARTRTLRVGLAVAAAERSQMIVKALRFRGVDVAIGKARLDGERNAGREAAA